MNQLLTLLLCTLLALPAQASDLARESRIAEQIGDAILDGEVVWLDTGGQRFMAIYTPSDARQVRGGAILLHGMGANPDWQDVVHPLRVGLPERGWATLSIQLPLAPADADSDAYLPLIPEALPRIQAAVDYLVEQQRIANQVVIGHSLGARMGLEAVARGELEPVRALVAIGLPTPRRSPDNPVLASIGRLRLPMLDIYGSQDLPQVVETARARRLAARGPEQPLYRQLVIDGADHFFHGQDDLLLSRIANWLGNTVSGSEIPAESGGRADAE